VFNTARIEALEVENLIEAAQATMVSAAARHECRGAHTVKDYERGADDAEFPLGRNDAEWMKHTLWHSAGQPAELQAGQPEAADGGQRAAQGPHVLIKPRSAFGAPPQLGAASGPPFDGVCLT
jgi:hypothetical protein